MSQPQSEPLRTRRKIFEQDGKLGGRVCGKEFHPRKVSSLPANSDQDDSAFVEQLGGDVRKVYERNSTLAGYVSGRMSMNKEAWRGFGSSAGPMTRPPTLPELLCWRNDDEAEEKRWKKAQPQSRSSAVCLTDDENTVAGAQDTEKASEGTSEVAIAEKVQ